MKEGFEVFNVLDLHELGMIITRILVKVHTNQVHNMYLTSERLSMSTWLNKLICKKCKTKGINDKE